MVQIAVEYRMHWMFIYFQAKVPLEELDVKRRQFNNQERRYLISRRIFTWTTFIIPSVLGIAIHYFVDNENTRDKFVGVLCLFWVGLLAYFVYMIVFSTLLFLEGLKLFQNYEYHLHKRGILTLTGAIIVSISIEFFVTYRNYVNLFVEHINK